MKSYLVVFNGNQTSRRSFTARLDMVSEIVNWMAFFDNAICIVSDADVARLTELIRVAVPDVQFVITALERGKKNGWLPKSVWNFVNHPIPLDAETAA